MKMQQELHYLKNTKEFLLHFYRDDFQVSFISSKTFAELSFSLSFEHIQITFNIFVVFCCAVIL